MDAPSLTISVPEAARMLGISSNHCWRAIERGELPSLKIGRRVLIPRRSLEAFVERAEHGAAAAAH
ncbi:MAG TPA: helix-turn-helix domain-containing protein [Candidatus Saccharimonadales bacterium]|nr:helix-turn-helix domain-containing protein [Candidatus Saccharimonadales bacterium]HVC42363.1 helix-turn-helix domain-containing protein [Candidatus Saccharimonadales bacterium]